MRGSIWIKARVWKVGRNGKIILKSGENMYGYGKVRDLDNKNQRVMAYKAVINKILATYRQEHGYDSDTELNYHILDDGIQSTRVINGKNRRIAWRQTRVKTQDKRRVHREVYTAREEKTIKRKANKRKDYNES